MFFESQGHTEPFARKRMEIGIGHYGWYAGVDYVEPFVRVGSPYQTGFRKMNCALCPPAPGGSATRPPVTDWLGAGVALSWLCKNWAFDIITAHPFAFTPKPT